LHGRCLTRSRSLNFSKTVLLIAPGLTVKNRLQVLVPGTTGNYYTEFQIIPPGLEDKIRQGQSCRVHILNWHKLDWETESQILEKRSVDKRGPKSDEAYVREVLGEMASAQNLLVINDEAHHAWRVPPKSRIAGISKDELDEATKWIGGLDRIHGARGILTCFDLPGEPPVYGKHSHTPVACCARVSTGALSRDMAPSKVKSPCCVSCVKAIGNWDASTKKSAVSMRRLPGASPDKLVVDSAGTGRVSSSKVRDAPLE